MTGIYGPMFAEIYDECGQIIFSLKMIAYLEDLLDRDQFRPSSAADLACGTGTLACAFAQKGWRAYGVDAAPSMLLQARQKARDMGLDVTFLQGQMQSFELPAAVDLITCVGDSLNYLTDTEDLRRTFAVVASHLHSGGVFVLDLLTSHGLATLWGHRTHFQDREDVALGVSGCYDEATERLSVTFTGFVERGTLYEKFTERHALRTFPAEEMTQALSLAGLRITGRYDGFSFVSPNQESPREVWLVCKGTD